LHLSVAAGIRTDSIAAWLSTDRVVRAMPNTPALIAQGMSGLYARVPEDKPTALTADDLNTVEQLMDTTGAWLWVREEKQLDAVTAISGSGPAYVFYFLESLVRAGLELDLDEETAKQLALHTFKGASALALGSSEPLAALRERVTSKGGTTYAALQAFAQAQVDVGIAAGVHAAAQRAKELGDEFGA
jgi:pyrroline-5-carboxylate reductase